MRRALRLRRLTAFVLIGFLALSFALFAGAGKLVDRQERRLLEERTAEVALLLQGTLRSSFQETLGTLTTAAGESPEAFRLTAQQLVDGSGLATVALVADSGRNEWVVESAAGTGLATGDVVAGPELDLVRRAGPTLRSSIVERGGDRSLAIVRAVSTAAGPAGGAAAGSVIYVQIAIDPYQETTVTSAEPFHELRAALYLGDRPDPSGLLLTTTDHLPMTGDTTQRAVTVGADSWLLVASARQPLAGTLLHNVPWLLALALLLIGMAMAGMVETVGRGRDRALRLVSARTAELEESLRELQRAQRAKSEFLSNMSHELRTPLNAIIGFSDLMTREPSDADAADRTTVPSEWIEHINASGLHLLDLINDILDLAKVEAGRIDLHPEALDMKSVVGPAVAALRPLMVRKQLELGQDIGAVTVFADRVRLRQIVDNLLSNAIKFTPEGGRIDVTARRIGDQVELRVADTGVGIAPEDHERVFEEFQQVGDRSSRASGTGLGLALTRQLVHAHGGTIALESAIGSGTRITVTVPAAPPPSETEPADVAVPDAHEGHVAAGTVLVIEDDPAAVRLLRAYLERSGYAVRVAGDGPTGLSEATSNPPDAIVLDVILPGVDGWEVLRRIKLDARSSSVPVVMVTVVDEQEVGLALGAVDYLIKPIDPAVLMRVLRRHIGVDVAAPTTALAIDDDESSLRVISACLKRQGIDVLTASGGDEGLALARSRRVDVILCDLLMPGMDGYTVVSELQRDPATRGIPILVVTAQDLSRKDKARLNGNILGIVQKGNTLEAGIRRWLARATRQISKPREEV